MLETLLALGLLHLAALASPGPDYLLVSRYALFHTLTHAIFASVGIALGVLTHAIISLSGLSLIFTQWPSALWAVRIIGALYLVSLGCTCLYQLAQPKHKRQSPAHKSQAATMKTQRPVQTTKMGQLITHPLLLGYLTNLINPKAIIFFVSLISAVIAPEALSQLGLMAALMLFLLTLIWFTCVALALSHPQIKARAQSHQATLETVTGVAFLLMGMTVIISPLLAPAGT